MNRNSFLYKALHKFHVMYLSKKNKITVSQLAKWYKDSRYPDSLRELKNIHSGERCFIIGNGPSLTPQDLSLIKDEITFSCNKIYKLIEQTEWKPYYYVVDDATFVSKDVEGIKSIPAIKKFIGVEYNKKIVEQYLDTEICVFFEKTQLKNLIPTISENIDNYIGSGHTVTFPMFQLAVYMGFKEIYFLGQDCSFISTLDQSYQGTNHFYSGDDYVISQEAADNVIYAFYAIKEYAEKNDIKVLNATRGGKLELFERVSLDELMRGNI